MKEDMSNKKKPQPKSSGRPKPLTPKAGVTKKRERRYDKGGKVKK